MDIIDGESRYSTIYESAAHIIYPLVTVGVTNYNTEKYIDQCLKSILAQDYGNIEVC